MVGITAWWVMVIHVELCMAWHCVLVWLCADVEVCCYRCCELRSTRLAVWSVADVRVMVRSLPP
jgi:hypothetical protein